MLNPRRKAPENSVQLLESIDKSNHFSVSEIKFGVLSQYRCHPIKISKGVTACGVVVVLVRVKRGLPDGDWEKLRMTVRVFLPDFVN
jgi:hypothetical protein